MVPILIFHFVPSSSSVVKAAVHKLNNQLSLPRFLLAKYWSAAEQHSKMTDYWLLKVDWWLKFFIVAVEVFQIFS